MELLGKSLVRSVRAVRALSQSVSQIQCKRKLKWNWAFVLFVSEAVSAAMVAAAVATADFADVFFFVRIRRRVRQRECARSKAKHDHFDNCRFFYRHTRNGHCIQRYLKLCRRHCSDYLPPYKCWWGFGSGFVSFSLSLCECFCSLLNWNT